ncbi:hypothetical protein E2562_011891 [Oryza meyeriana var. granulata]|uniref:Secreted protein n=1 Tax=Oryza meyeriana var. granulata TaxID=110450 RepID=A0A6G1CF74_9ORYZ|nr:hypothetical protein E2562_011891 [Oryza meyeriana var. granulata]
MARARALLLLLPMDALGIGCGCVTNGPWEEEQASRQADNGCKAQALGDGGIEPAAQHAVWTPLASNSVAGAQHRHGCPVRP